MNQVLATSITLLFLNSHFATNTVCGITTTPQLPVPQHRSRQPCPHHHYSYTPVPRNGHHQTPNIVLVLHQSLQPSSHRRSSPYHARTVLKACRRIRETQVLPAVSIQYANSMSLLKANMPIGCKDPAKDVDRGMAGGYSELKEPRVRRRQASFRGRRAVGTGLSGMFRDNGPRVWVQEKIFSLIVQRFQTLVPFQPIAPDPLIPTTCFSFSNFTSSSLISDVGID